MTTLAWFNARNKNYSFVDNKQKLRRITTSKQEERDEEEQQQQSQKETEKKTKKKERKKTIKTIRMEKKK